MTHLLKNEDGATALEYGLLGALIAAAISIAIGTLGSQMSGIFTQLSTAISSVL